MSIHLEPIAGDAFRTWMPIPRVNVLLVEDTAFYRRFIQSVCDRAHWIALHHVATLAEADAALASVQPMVILLDVNLPDGDGIAWLRARRDVISAAVVLLTADTTHDPSIIASIVQDYLVKTQIAPEQLLRAVRYAAERRRFEEAVRHRDDQLRQAQKMEAIGRLAGGVAHDFSNLLTVITTACERMSDTLAADALERSEVEKILRNSARAASLTRKLLAFSREQALIMRPLDLGALVKSTGQLLEQLIGEHIALTIDVGPDLLPTEADAVQMEQVLLNLAINARDAMPRGGALAIRLVNVVASPLPADADGRDHRQFVLLQVSDTGSGMSAEVKTHAFEPFYTTKGENGTGLGLATVYGIIAQSGGHIDIETAEGRGTTFNIFLPVTDRPVPVEAPPPAAVPARVEATILLTEDEPDVRDLLRDMLAGHGYKVLVAQSADQALQFAEHATHPIDLLVTDVVMPGATGRDLARRLRALRPGLKVLFMSGYPEPQHPEAPVPDVEGPLLRKPFSRADLLHSIHALLG